MAGAGTFSSFNLKRPMTNFNKKLVKDLAIQTANFCHSVGERFPQNTQGVLHTTIFDLFTDKELDYIFAVNINTNPDTQRLLLGAANMCLNIANPSNAPVCFDIYDIGYRQDMPLKKTPDNLFNSPNSIWFDGNFDMGITDIITPGQIRFSVLSSYKI
jgi:hypothetical protein